MPNEFLYIKKKKILSDNPTLEELKVVESVGAMKAAIKDHINESVIVKHCFSLAYHKGWSDDDAITVLAFQALARCERLEEKVIKLIRNSRCLNL